MIPKIIHFVWIGGTMPWWAEKNIAKFVQLNPDFIVKCHGEEVMLDCFSHAYGRIDENPQSQYHYARRSDILRVCALLRWGGWYFDCDFLPIRPLKELYGMYTPFRRGCFLTQGDNHHVTGEPVIANGVIGTTAESRILSMITKEIVRLACTEDEIGWDYYGPRLYTDLVARHPELVHVGAMEEFYPIRERAESMAAYKRMADADFTREAMVAELGEPLPHMFHMSMQGETEL